MSSPNLESADAHASFGVSSLVPVISGILRSTRLPLTDEKDTQAAASLAFSAMGLAHVREYALGSGDIVDFFFPLAGSEDAGVALEFKLRAQKRAVHRQCERYAAHDRVAALVLATATSMGFPESLHGKPCYVVNLGRAWL